MRTPAGEARGLARCFGDLAALTGLDLVAVPGQVAALRGPNGAGTTTFGNAVATLLGPHGGDLCAAGLDALAIAGRAAPRPPAHRPGRTAASAE